MRRLLFVWGLLFLVCLPFSALPAHADVGPCQVFPPDNPWNRDVSADPVHPQSAAIISFIGIRDLHPDFGGDTTDYYGIPWTTVTNSQSNANSVTFDYDDESDPGPYPLPYNAPVEGGRDPVTGENYNDGDRHVLVINTDTCILYELYGAEFTGDYSDGTPNTWTAGSGAIFDLNSNDLRPDGWTSADAAGLPVFPGLVRCDEVMSGEINHAVRFTVTNSKTKNEYVYPATHEASSVNDPRAIPFGARVRLKADYDLSGFTGQSLVIATAMKRYGMIMADNGSSWFFSGDYDPNCWDDEDLEQLKDISSSAFEVLAYPGTGASSAPSFATKTPTLSWGRVTWAVSYEVQISKNAAFGSPTNYTASGTSLTLPGPGLNEGTYYWHVRAKDANNTLGAWSTTGSFVIAMVP